MSVRVRRLQRHATRKNAGMSDEDFVAALDHLDDGLQTPEKARTYSLEEVLMTGEEEPSDAPRPRAPRPPAPPTLDPLALVVGIGMGSGGALALMVFSDRVIGLLGF